jgi:hypothetical protein
MGDGVMCVHTKMNALDDDIRSAVALNRLETDFDGP